MVIAAIGLGQFAVGVWLDRYNRSVGRFCRCAAMYPLFVLLVMLLVTVTATPRALFGRRPPHNALAHRPRPVERETVALDAAA